MNPRHAILPALALLLVGCGGSGSDHQLVTIHLVWDPTTTVQAVHVEAQSDTHGNQFQDIPRPAGGTTDVTMSVTTDAKFMVYGTGIEQNGISDSTGVIDKLPLQDRTIRFGGPATEIHLTGFYYELGSGEPQSYSMIPGQAGQAWIEDLRAWGTGAGGELVMFAASDVQFSSSNPSVVGFLLFGSPFPYAAGVATLSVQDGPGGPTDSWPVTVVSSG